MLSKDKWEMLQRVVQRPITCAEMPTNKELNDVQDLTKLGYIRDYGLWYGKRIPVNLRIWGITPAGRAALEQQALTEHTNRGQTQFSLTMAQSSSLPIKPVTLLRPTKLSREKIKTPSELLVERVKAQEERGE